MKLTFENILADGSEEVTFDIVGTRTDDEGLRTKVVETFTCLPEAPAGSSEMLIKGATTADYVLSVLIPKDETRFRALLADKDFRVQSETVRAIYNGLLEHYTGRPTGAPSASGPGRESNGDSSEDDSSSADSINEASA